MLKGFFDLYLENIMEPAHLLTGIGNPLIEVFFSQRDNTDH